MLLVFEHQVRYHRLRTDVRTIEFHAAPGEIPMLGGRHNRFHWA